jgi:hypothetical protein
MDEVTQQNAALVEEAAAAAESLEEQAHNLSSAVSIFKLDDTAAAPRLSAPRRQRSSAQTSPRGERLGAESSQPYQPVLMTNGKSSDHERFAQTGSSGVRRTEDIAVIQPSAA